MSHLLERSRGYKDALKHNSIEVLDTMMPTINPINYKSDIHKAVNYLLSSKAKCDAIYFSTDRIAIYGLQQINALGKKVPEDVSVLSFDESEAFELFYCRITHARQPLEKMGKLAVNLLLELINKNKIMNQIYLESDFVIGKSCKE